MPVPRAPRFLQAFVHTLDNDHEGWIAECPICTCEGMTIRPDTEQGTWRFACQDGCAHEEVVGWLQVDARLSADAEREEATRGWMCLMLAPTLETYQALIAGERVALHALRQEWVQRFSTLASVSRNDGHVQQPGGA